MGTGIRLPWEEREESIMTLGEGGVDSGLGGWWCIDETAQGRKSGEGRCGLYTGERTFSSKSCPVQCGAGHPGGAQQTQK